MLRPTWKEPGISKRRERRSARLVTVPRGAEVTPLAMPPQLVPGTTGAEAAMVPPTLAVGCLCWALLFPGHCPAQIFEWPRMEEQPLVTTPLLRLGAASASVKHPQGTHKAPSAWVSLSASSCSPPGAWGAAVPHSCVSSSLVSPHRAQPRFALTLPGHMGQVIPSLLSVTPEDGL